VTGRLIKSGEFFVLFFNAGDVTQSLVHAKHALYHGATPEPEIPGNFNLHWKLCTHACRPSGPLQLGLPTCRWEFILHHYSGLQDLKSFRVSGSGPL
jgi:hypothetical protein